MKEGVKLTKEELRLSASDIRKKIESMKMSLSNATNIMGRIGESFVGEASDSLINKYNELKPAFDDFYNKMHDYAKFLDKTANDYEADEQGLKKIAEDLS